MEKGKIITENLPHHIEIILRQIQGIETNQYQIAGKIEEYKKLLKSNPNPKTTDKGKKKKKTNDNIPIEPGLINFEKRMERILNDLKTLFAKTDSLAIMMKKYYEWKKYSILLISFIILFTPAFYDLFLRQPKDMLTQSYFSSLFIILSTSAVSFIKGYLKRKTIPEIYHLIFVSLCKGLIMGFVAIMSVPIVKTLGVPENIDAILEWQVLLSWVIALII